MMSDCGQDRFFVMETFEPKAERVYPFGLGDPLAEAQRRSRPRAARREAVALTAKRSEGLGGLGGLPPIGVKKSVSEANSFWGGPGGLKTTLVKVIHRLRARIFSFKYLLKPF